MVSLGPKALVGVCTVLSGWMPFPSCSTVTRNGAGGGGGGVWATGGGGDGGGGCSLLQPEGTSSDTPNRAAFRSIGVPPVYRAIGRRSRSVRPLESSRSS